HPSVSWGRHRSACSACASPCAPYPGRAHPLPLLCDGCRRRRVWLARGAISVFAGQARPAHEAVSGGCVPTSRLCAPGARRGPAGPRSLPRARSVSPETAPARSVLLWFWRCSCSSAHLSVLLLHWLTTVSLPSPASRPVHRRRLYLVSSQLPCTCLSACPA